MSQALVIGVDLKLPFINSIKGDWSVNPDEVRASWEAYIEIVTRILPSHPSQHNRRIDLELAGLQELSQRLREILKKAGPSVGQTLHDDDLSFAYLTLSIINVVLRPVLLHHADCVGTPERGLSFGQRSTAPSLYAAKIAELDQVYAVLTDFCNLLTQAAGVRL